MQLTEEQRHYIRNSPGTNREMARQFSISPGTVHKIRHSNGALVVRNGAAPKKKSTMPLEPEVMPLVVDRMDGTTYQVPRSNFSKWKFKLAVNAPFEDWVERLQEAATIRRGANWFLADCLNHPQADTDQGVQAIAALQALPQYADLTDGTLANIKSIGARWKPEQRHMETLSWSHHAALTYIKDLDEREKLAQIAEREQLNVTQTRERVGKKTPRAEVQSNVTIEVNWETAPKWRRDLRARVRDLTTVVEATDLHDKKACEAALEEFINYYHAQIL